MPNMLKLWHTRTASVLALGFITMACGGPNKDVVSEAVVESQTLARASDVDVSAPPRAVLFSGHSLLDHPTQLYVAEIAKSLGSELEWNRQNIGGSGIWRRMRGENRDSPTWEGLREGDNKDGTGMDVEKELRAPATVSAQKYDALVITEWHRALDAILWNDTTKYLRRYHDLLVQTNPNAVTYFYEPWLDIEDKNDPASWIAYERAVSPIWQCVTTRINVSLEHEGRQDRVIALPAGAALAELVERLTTSTHPFPRDESLEQRINRVMYDQVHVTPLGSYYMSLVTYASMYRRSPAGSWWPEGVSQEQATFLQRVAWEFVSRYYDRYAPLSLEQCRERLLDDVLDIYWTYQRRVIWAREVGTLHSYVRMARYYLRSWRLVRREDDSNPFAFDPKTDSAYWFGFEAS